MGVEGDQGWDSRKGGCLCQKRSGEDKYHDPWSKGRQGHLLETKVAKKSEERTPEWRGLESRVQK